MRSVCCVVVKRFEFDYTCSGDVSKSVDIQQIEVFDKKWIRNYVFNHLLHLLPVVSINWDSELLNSFAKLICFQIFFQQMANSYC